jgi:hypothetical protein
MNYVQLSHSICKFPACAGSLCGTGPTTTESLRGHDKWDAVYLYSGNGKGKAVPLQAWSGPEGSRKLRFPYYMATAQDGGEVVSLTHRPPLPPGKYLYSD